MDKRDIIFLYASGYAVVMAGATVVLRKLESNAYKTTYTAITWCASMGVIGMIAGKIL